MQTTRIAMVVSTFFGFLAHLGPNSAFAQDLQKSNQSFSAVYSMVKQRESAKLGISPVDFETRWGADEDAFELDANGVIRDSKLHSVDEITTGSIPFSRTETSVSSKASNSESIVKVAFGSINNVPECGPSSLSETEIRTLVVGEAEGAGVDANFALAIVKAESNFDRVRNSPKGARGPMQLMPGTASDYDVSDICDPAENIRGGVAHLARLFDLFENPLIVAAAYNAGEARIAEYGGIPPFVETLNYVAKVINFRIGLDPPTARKSPAAREQMTAQRERPSPSAASSGLARTAKGEWVAGVLQF